MAKRLIILAACAAMEAGASDQPASKTFLITGETKLLTPASQAITANDQASSAATIVAVREFEFQVSPSEPPREQRHCSAKMPSLLHRP